MKVTITSNIAVITSSIKAKDMRMLQACNKDALTIKSDDNQDKFVMRYDQNRCALTDFCIVFNGETRDDEKLATMTLTIPSENDTVDTAKAFLANKLLSAIEHIIKLEANAHSEIERINNHMKSIMDDITVL